MVPLLKVDSVVKSYTMDNKNVDVLRSIDLSVREGEVLAISGKSGAGKSTLIHVMGALDRPDRGKVVLRGENVYNMSGGRRAWIRASQIGFIFQSYRLFPEMDVLENVMLPSMAYSRIEGPLSEPRERALDLLAAVDLEDRADHLPLELSGGEQQRVAVARALMNDPEIIFADEPVGNLDEDTGAHVLDTLFSLSKERGHTLVIVTHNEKICKMCGRTLRIVDGVIQS